MHPAAELIYAVRHARPASAWGGTDADPGLDEVGRLQAEDVGRALSDAGVRRIVSSPFRRCRETAAPLAKQLGVEIELDPELGEIPQPAGLPTADRPSWLEAALAGRWRDVAGGDYLAWRAGVAAALARYPRSAVFTHYVALNAAASYALGEERVRTFEPGHASVSTFRVREGRLRIAQLAQSAATTLL